MEQYKIVMKGVQVSLGEQGWRSSERARLPPMCPDAVDLIVRVQKSSEVESIAQLVNTGQVPRLLQSETHPTRYGYHTMCIP